MFGHPTYIIWLTLFIGAPLLALLVVGRRALWARRAALGWALFGALCGGWAWDALIVRIGGWYYDPNNIVNVWLAGLPLEEWLWIAGVTLMFGGLTVVLEDRLTRQADKLT